VNEDFINTLLLTGKLAGWTTVILLVIGFPVAYLLAYRRFPLKVLVEALISMPMVLPPTVLGFYMLVVYSPQNAFGRFIAEYFDVRLAFSFEGILIAIPKSLREASYTLGKSEFTTFIWVLIPNMIPSIITAVAMTFAHCIGEFGVIIMVGGNIPGETRVASIAIYDEVQAMNFQTANQYSLVLFGISLVLLTIIFAIKRTPNP